MSRMFFAVLATVGALSSSAVASFDNKIVYGNDDRTEVFAVPQAALREVADSTVAMIPNRGLAANGTGGIRIAASVFGNEYGLCKDEPYFSQPIAAMCSGFLIGPDLIATAGHCIQAADCAQNSFVFGYKMVDAQTPALDLPANEVYKCKEVVSRELTRNQDYAVVRLDRPVVGHRVLSLARQDVSVGDPLVVIGHPAGLPTKVAGGANVRSLGQGFFAANLDTYGGNSGSAVFNANTLEVVGILVRGGTDFVYDRAGSCTRSNYVADNSGRGEDVTLVSFVRKAIGQ